MGTGLVMSVPAHAPKDYQALIDLKEKNHELASKIEPVGIITTEGYGEIPARDVCERLRISNQSDSKLEEATNEIYLKEFVGGKLNERCGEFSGEKVEFGRDKVRDWLKDKKLLENFHTFILKGVKDPTHVIMTEAFKQAMPNYKLTKAQKDDVWKICSLLKLTRCCQKKEAKGL